MVFENFDIHYKLSILNILSKIIQQNLVNENFHKMKGFSVLFKELKKTGNCNLKILTLHFFNELLQSHHNFFYFKAHGIVNFLEELLSKSQNYLETLLIIKLYSILVMDEDLSIKIADKSLTTIAKLLLKCHPSKRGQMYWDENGYNKSEDLFVDLQNHCFRLLRYLYNIKKNKNVFKFLFPSKIFVHFLDIGNFVKIFMGIVRDNCEFLGERCGEIQRFVKEFQ